MPGRKQKSKQKTDGKNKDSDNKGPDPVKETPAPTPKDNQEKKVNPPKKSATKVTPEPERNDGSVQLKIIQKKLRNRRKQLAQAQQIQDIVKKDPNAKLEPEQIKKLKNLEMIKTLVTEFEGICKAIEEAEEELNKKNKEKLREQRKLEGLASKSIVQLFAIIQRADTVSPRSAEEKEAASAILGLKDTLLPTITSDTKLDDDFWANVAKPIMPLAAMTRDNADSNPKIRQNITRLLSCVFDGGDIEEGHADSPPTADAQEQQVAESRNDADAEPMSNVEESNEGAKETADTEAVQEQEGTEPVIPNFMGASFLNEAQEQQASAQAAAEAGLLADPAVIGGSFPGGSIPTQEQQPPQHSQVQQEEDKQKNNGAGEFQTPKSRGRGRGSGGRGKPKRGRGSMNGGDNHRGKGIKGEEADGAPQGGNNGNQQRGRGRGGRNRPARGRGNGAGRNGGGS
eukprot:m.338589 g.338589  ORF g.338589 m.338589 type:complete len:456 (+) comp18470_c0_seq1:67-1434(+)